MTARAPWQSGLKSLGRLPNLLKRAGGYALYRFAKAFPGIGAPFNGATTSRETGPSKADPSTVWQRHFENVFGFADWVDATLGDRPFDICIAHDSFALEAARSLKARTGCALVFDAVEYPDYTGRFGAMAAAFRAYPRGHDLVLAHERQIQERADIIIAGTPGVQSLLARNPRLPGVHLVRNCLDYQPMPSDDRIRTDCGLGPEDRLLLVPNSLHDNASLDLILDTLALLPDHVHLAFMGNMAKPGRTERSEKFQARGIQGRVHFLPLRLPNDLIEYRSGADLAMIPLDPDVPVYKSALPNRVFESIMSRTPLVISDLPHIRDVLEEHDCGAVFQHRTPESIAGAVIRVLDNASQFRANMDAAAEALCWANERAKYLDALDPLIDNRHALSIVVIANKRLTTNRRVFRHTRSLVEQGHKVTVLSRYKPLEYLRDPNIEYFAMHHDDPILRRFTGPE